MTGSFKHGNGPSDFIELWELLASSDGLWCREIAGYELGSMLLLTKVSVT